MPCLYVYNKVDTVYIEDVDRLARLPTSTVISCHMKLGLDNLLVEVGCCTPQFSHLQCAAHHLLPRAHTIDCACMVVLAPTRPGTCWAWFACTPRSEGTHQTLRTPLCSRVAAMASQSRALACRFTEHWLTSSTTPSCGDLAPNTTRRCVAWVLSGAFGFWCISHQSDFAWLFVFLSDVACHMSCKTRMCCRFVDLAAAATPRSFVLTCLRGVLLWEGYRLSRRQ